MQTTHSKIMFGCQECNPVFRILVSYLLHLFTQIPIGYTCTVLPTYYARDFAFHCLVGNKAKPCWSLEHIHI